MSEHPVMTGHGHPFAEPMPTQPVSGMDFEKAAVLRRELGLDGLKVTMTRDLDDPAFSNQVLGLPE